MTSCTSLSRLTLVLGMPSQVRSPALRRQVYATLLAAMPDELRLTVYSKLASDVLGAVAEGTIALSVAASATGPAELGTTELLLTEVLQLLSTPPLRVQTKRGAAGAASAAADDDDEADGNGGAEGAAALQATIAAAKSRLVAKLMKRQIAEQVLPVVLGLRQVLQAARSPVMGALLGYVKTLFEDYGEEISGACPPRAREPCLAGALCTHRLCLPCFPFRRADALADNRQLASELEQDVQAHTQHLLARTAALAGGSAAPGSAVLGAAATGGSIALGVRTVASRAAVTPSAPRVPLRARESVGAGVTPSELDEVRKMPGENLSPVTAPRLRKVKAAAQASLEETAAPLAGPDARRHRVPLRAAAAAAAAAMQAAEDAS